MGNGVKLPYMKADPNSVTVSGHSMGCFMSEKMMIIHSQNVKMNHPTPLLFIYIRDLG